MLFISACEPRHRKTGVTEERRGKVNFKFKLFYRCLPFAVHLGFWDKGCLQHHDCCLPGLQKMEGGGWKSGERSLEDGPRVPLSSVERKRQYNKWLPVAYLRAAYVETTCLGILSFQTFLNSITKISNLALYVSPIAPKCSVAPTHLQHEVSTSAQHKCPKLFTDNYYFLLQA